MDLHGLRAVPRLPGFSVLSELLRAVFRRAALCVERRLAADRRLFRARVFPQLVSPVLPLRLRDFPIGATLACTPEPLTPNSPATCATASHAPARRPCPAVTCMTTWAPRSSRRSRICPNTV